MFAMFGLGLQEILLLAALALVPIAVAVVVLVGRASGSRTRALEAENDRLREELDRAEGRKAD